MNHRGRFGYHVPAVTEPAVRRLGRYQIQEEIGRGAMGVVYRAIDPDLGRVVALKAVQLAFAVPPAEREVFEKRFVAEARAAARLSHPAIVVVHDAGRDDESGTLYIAFEYLEGQTLEGVTARGARVDGPEALRIAARIAEALHHAHERGIIHRDIKPANVMLQPSGELKVMDFGIAKLPAGQLTATGQFFGTPSYMSPEQLAGERLDGRSDLFSLGAVLYRLLTGQDAFSAPSVPAVLARVSRYNPPAPSTIVPGLSPETDAVMARILAKDPRQRYPDGVAMATALEAVRSNRPPAAVRSLETAPSPKRSRRRRAALVLAAVTGAALLAGVAVPWSTLPPPQLRTPPPAELELKFDHPLRTGTLSVWVDDVLVLEEPLESRVVEDLMVYRVRKGRAEAVLKVPPGEHVVRLGVRGEGYNGSKRIRGSFESGSRRRLEARVGGLLTKDLSMWWGS
jgi:serine/threonine-protein kinase